jgi:hypothetical protein
MDTTKQKTHGNYRDTANISQALKGVMSIGKNWEALKDTQREALELIAMKIARILSGDQNYRDHWDDIEGYAELGGDNGGMSMPQINLDLTKALGGNNG